MSTSIQSAALSGITGIPVNVEVDLLRRLPAMVIVGLPGGAVREVADRVRSAVDAAGFEFPRQRVVVNLAPADLHKQGTQFDLPIALGVLAASDQVDLPKGLAAFGELSLDGSVRPVRGLLPMVEAAVAAGAARILVPLSQAAEAAACRSEVSIYCVASLTEATDWLLGRHGLASPYVSMASGVVDPWKPYLVMSDIQGKESVKEQLREAAKTRQSVCLLGRPGCGKTMLAARANPLLPDLTIDERLEVMRIQSAAGLLQDGTGLEGVSRPFRAPHHTISAAGMIGDNLGRPGEASIAHAGVLFLDDIEEFSGAVIELLRAVVAEKRVVLNRAAGTIRLPADFWLIVASQTCPCGQVDCHCLPTTKERWIERRDKMLGLLGIETIIAVGD